ncbi:reverse transcriptase domain-containing protein [Tanacetum coccineum]|uniref:Reverse transcriptase domain-containing protein n=1 Tax=Tanacetum coccineum TaxID=301880 RepID=A0ABQ5H0S5_9ASTR
MVIAQHILLITVRGLIFCPRSPRGGIEANQFSSLQNIIKDVKHSDHRDTWTWIPDIAKGFSVASVRQLIDSCLSVGNPQATRWIQAIPIKVNVFLWRLFLNKLPSRVNLDKKGIDLDSLLCPVCNEDVETVNHLFFSCDMAKDLWSLLARWWGLDIPVCSTILDWYAWLDELVISSKARVFLEGVGGPESPPELQRSWCVEGHIRFRVISSVLMQRYLRTTRQSKGAFGSAVNDPTEAFGLLFYSDKGAFGLTLGDEGLNSEGTKLKSVFITTEKKTEEGMVDSQPEEEEIRGVETRNGGTKTHRGPIKPVLQTQKTPYPSPAFIKENIDILRTMIKEHDQQAKTKATSRKLAYADSDKEALTRSLARGGAARNWFDDLDPKSVDSFEELSQKFLEEFSQQKRYAKDPTEIHGIKRRQNEGLQAFMDRFKSESSHIKGVPPVLRILAFMHGHGHPKLAKKLNDKIPKTVDEMFERVRAFIRGEVATRSAEMVRPSQGDKGYIRPAWTETPEKARSRGGLREARRNIGIYTLYPRKDTFTPLIKTPKEILAMERVTTPMTAISSKANKESCGLWEVSSPGEGHPSEQPAKRESRKE